MSHEVKNYESLIQECQGFLSEAQLRNHFTLYQGYVKKMNEIEEKLTKADPTTANYSFGEYSELKRREPVAYNGTFLHELYFSNLGNKDQPIPLNLNQALQKDFGSLDRWLADVKAIIGSGHGWALVCFDWNVNRIKNIFVQSEHHVGLMPNQTVLMAIDGWEHAYFMDYGTKKVDYVAGVLSHLNWKTIEQRFKITPYGK